MNFSLNLDQIERCACAQQVKDSLKSRHRAQEDLEASRQECDRLQVELQQVLIKLDSHVR